VNPMSIAQTAAVQAPTPAIPKDSNPAKIKDAAQQFEALLLGQILETVSQGAGWLGSGEDSSSSCANGFAQEQLAAMMARQGGFGLSGLIAQGLERAK
jgi:Rod binding domain-containing protein